MAEKNYSIFVYGTNDNEKETYEEAQDESAADQKENDPDTLANPTELKGGGNPNDPKHKTKPSEE